MSFQWLRDQQHIATWLQGIGVSGAIVFAGFQLWDTKLAIRASADANAIALNPRLSDIALRINEISIEHPEISPPFTLKQRLHLMRLEYFFEIFNQNNEGLIDVSRLSAEESYLRWTVNLPEFPEAWNEVSNQYPREFKAWIERTTQLPQAAESQQSGINHSEFLPAGAGSPCRSAAHVER